MTKFQYIINLLIAAIAIPLIAYLLWARANLLLEKDVSSPYPYTAPGVIPEEDYSELESDWYSNKRERVRISELLITIPLAAYSVANFFANALTILKKGELRRWSVVGLVASVPMFLAAIFVGGIHIRGWDTFVVLFTLPVGFVGVLAAIKTKHLGKRLRPLTTGAQAAKRFSE